MLVLPTDSGYNSPCDGFAPLSLQSPLEKFSRPEISAVVRQKLRFESPCWNSRSYCDPLKPNDRLRKIARRLLQLCDSFDKGFTEVAEETKDFTWASSILRIIGF